MLIDLHLGDDTIAYLAHKSTTDCTIDWLSDMRGGRFVLDLPIVKEAILMARKKGNEPNKTGQPANLRWINIQITEADEPEIERWNPDDATLFAGLAELIASGHAVGWKRASDGNGFMAYATGGDDICPNRGLGLSAFAGTPRDAIIALLWKHYTIAEGIWPKPSNDTGRKYR